MSTNYASTNQSQSDQQASSSQNGSQSGKKENSSRIKSVKPTDTTFARFDGEPPKNN